MKLKERYPWKECFIAIVIVTIGAFFIHIKFNTPPNFNLFFISLPFVWLLVILLMIVFTEFLNFGRE